MGLSRMFAFTVDGVSIWHPGDLGRLPTDDQIDALGPADVLLLPVGGRFTLPIPEAIALMDRLAPRWTVPMHYKSDRVDLDMATLDEFLAEVPTRPLVSVPGSELDDATDPGLVLLRPAL